MNLKSKRFGGYSLEELQAIQANGLNGGWRTHEGLVCSGTVRVARADFDSSPSAEVQANILTQLCAASNALPHLLAELQRLTRVNAQLSLQLGTPTE